MTTVRDLNENDLLARLTPLLPRGTRTSVPTGDDAMVLDPSDGRVVVTTDVLVEGRHFRRDWSTAEQIGRRAVAQNFADLAAMGALPLSIVVGLVLPGDTELDWLEGLWRGLGQACQEAGAGVDGGDLSGGDTVTIAVTALGDLRGRAPVVRSAARPGDVVAHVGDLGRSATGYALLNAGVSQPPAHRQQWAIDGFRVPQPPLGAGPAAAQSGVRAMMDVSDGMLRDCARIARASSVAIDLDLTLERWVQAVALLESAGSADARSAVLSGGEDHGLLATFPAQRQLPAGWEPVGRVHAAAPPGTVTVNGASPAAAGVLGEGWDHFRASS